MYSCDIAKSLLKLNDLAGLKTVHADLLKQLKVVDTRATSIPEPFLKLGKGKGRGIGWSHDTQNIWV